MTLSESIKRYINRSILFRQQTDLSPSQKWVLGLINLTCVVLFWVLSSFLISDLFESEIYRKPFLITYLNTSCFSFYLIPYLRYENLSLKQFIINIRKEWNNDTKGLEDDHTDMEVQPLINEQIPQLEIGILETISLSFKFCTLWFCANLVTNSSLSYTSVASQTILSSTSSFFTLLVGFIYAVENINKNKVYGIVLCFSGVLIVTKDDLSAENPTHSDLLTFFGNILALSGALIYGVYTILLKLKTTIPHSTLERNLNTHLFFAFVGLFCFIALWPIIIILHFTKVETFVIPKDSHILTLLLINMLITFISDFCWCKAVLLTSPLTVTVGLSLTIPLAMIGDWVFKQFKFNWIYATGAAIVTLGFLIINKDERNDFVDHID